jgi:hypothetical protein
MRPEMAHSISQYDGVALVRIDGRINAQEIYQALKNHLDLNAGGPVIVIIDLSFATALGQPVKAIFYRVLQHHNVLKAGFFGASPAVKAELADLVPTLGRVRPVAVEATEADVRQKFGLVKTPAERKLSGMLSYLRKNP